MNNTNNAIIRFTQIERLEKIIEKCDVCQVAMVDGDKPYLVTMNFGYKNQVFYLHSDKEGQKIDILKKNNNVSLMFYTDTEIFARDIEIGCSWRMKYKSVLVHGKLFFIEDFNQKQEALKILMSQYTDKEIRFSKPAIDNVIVMKVEIDKWSGRSFEHPNELYEK